MEAPSDAHRCAWRDEAEELRGKLAAALLAIESLERRVFGPKSEKMPSPEKELRRGAPK